MGRNQSEVSGSLAVDFVGGLSLGVALDPVTTEGFAHQSLAHRTIEYQPQAGAVCRFILNSFGLSVNRFATSHRVHHAQQYLRGKDTIMATSKVVLANATGRDDLESNRQFLLFPGFSFDNDPLIRETDGQLSFRNNPPLERFVSRSMVHKAIPPLALIAAGGVVNKLLGRDRPFRRSAATIVGLGLGLSVDSATTSYAENRAGVTSGRIQQQRVRPLHRERLERHQAHHDQPWALEAGQSRRHRASINLVKRLGLVR